MESNNTGTIVKNLFGKNLKRLRATAKKSQVKLSTETGLAHNFINDIENGKKWASAKTIETLAIALNVEPYQFFLPNSKQHKQEGEIVAYYLEDFSDSITKVMEDYRYRYSSEKTEEGEK